MPPELDLHLLRSFVVVAEELHFTRAAGRLHVAQQVLSRDIRRLEAQLGVALFARDTRHVTITAHGERLLEHARALLALNDAALNDLGGVSRPLVVDVIGEALTAQRIVDAARQSTPAFEFTVRFGGGMGAAIPRLLAGRLDVAFGRVEGIGRPFPAELSHQIVRHEPLALLIPDGHPLAERADVPCDLLRGLEVDASVGNDDAPEWVDLAVSLLEAFGGRPSPSHPHVVGTGETARHLQVHGIPILTLSERPAVPGAVLRPLVEPVPTYPWAMVYRRDARHPALAALRSAAAELAVREGWDTTTVTGRPPNTRRDATVLLRRQ